MTETDPDAEPLVTCPNDKIGTDDMRWQMVVAVAARTRTMRLDAARRVIRSRSGLISQAQRRLMHSIIEGTGDAILQKCLQYGINPD